MLIGIDMSEDELYAIMEQCREYFAGLQVETTDERTFRFTISSGVITYDPKIKERNSVEVLFKLCDNRLLAAKDGGKNRVYASKDVI